MSKRRTCCRKGCNNQVRGMEQVCADCRARDLVCRDCGEPHGGPVPTTKLCPICRSKKRRKPRGVFNPPWTPEEDEVIREVYAKFNHRKKGAELRRRFPTRPRWSITRRAAVIGAATVRTKEPPWSDAENAILAKFGWQAPEVIAAKLRAAGHHRTVTAVAIRINRTRIRTTIGGMTANALGQMLGADVKTVTRWIEQGWLAGERRANNGKKNHDPYFIQTEAIRAFFIAHPELIELSRLERVGSKMWFLELLTNGQVREYGESVPGRSDVSLAASGPARTVALAGERVSLAALADISGRTAAALLHRIDGLGMSVEQAAFGPEDGEAPPAYEPDPADAVLAEQVRAVLKKHRARPADLVRWAGLPAGIVSRVLTGTMPLVAPALHVCLEKLDVELAITAKHRPGLEPS